MDAQPKIGGFRCFSSNAIYMSYFSIKLFLNFIYYFFHRFCYLQFLQFLQFLLLNLEFCFSSG